MIKILIVDDEPGLCEMVKRIFKPIGFTVLTATDGQTAISIIKQERPKVVLLDIKMLGVSGFDVLKEAKQIDLDIKVIMVTVLDDEMAKAEARRLGADGFVTKPFSSEHLEDIVRNCITNLIEQKERDK